MAECVLAGRRGEKGDTGPQGATGATGPQGPAGPSGSGGTITSPSIAAGLTIRTNQFALYEISGTGTVGFGIPGESFRSGSGIVKFTLITL